MSGYSNSYYRKTNDNNEQHNQEDCDSYTSDELDLFRHAFTNADTELHLTGYWASAIHSSVNPSVVRTNMACAILQAAANGERSSEILKNYALSAVKGHALFAVNGNAC